MPATTTAPTDPDTPLCSSSQGSVQILHECAEIDHRRVRRAAGIDRIHLSLDQRPQHDENGEFFYPYVKTFKRRVTVQFNPSRILDPYGYSIATVEDALDVSAEVWELLCRYVAPRTDLSSATISRLDIAKDFTGSLEPGRLLLAFERIPRPYQRDTHLRRNARTGLPQSLAIGSKESRVILYDKHVETHGLAPRGTVRWENQLHTRKLGATFSQLSPELVEELALARWQWSKMGTPVISEQTAFEVIEDLDVSPTIRARLWLDLSRLAKKGMYPSDSRHRRDLDNLIAQHGIIVADTQPLPSGLSVTERMDWDTGTVVSSLDDRVVITITGPASIITPDTEKEEVAPMKLPPLPPTAEVLADMKAVLKRLPPTAQLVGAMIRAGDTTTPSPAITAWWTRFDQAFNEAFDDVFGTDTAAGAEPRDTDALVTVVGVEHAA